METPDKQCPPEAGYRTRGVRGLPPVPAMASKQVTETRSRGAADIRRTPVGDTVYDDAD